MVVTVNMLQLQKERIQFTPTLPRKYQQAIASFQMEPAVKVFLEFNHKFYPPVWVIERDWKDYSLRESSANYADRIFYDEIFHQPKEQQWQSTQHCGYVCLRRRGAAICRGIQ